MHNLTYEKCVCVSICIENSLWWKAPNTLCDAGWIISEPKAQWKQIKQSNKTSMRAPQVWTHRELCESWAVSASKKELICVSGMHICSHWNFVEVTKCLYLLCTYLFIYLHLSVCLSIEYDLTESGILTVVGVQFAASKTVNVITCG